MGIPVTRFRARKEGPVRKNPVVFLTVLALVVIACIALIVIASEILN